MSALRQDLLSHIVMSNNALIVTISVLDGKEKNSRNRPQYVIKK
jgi:hypothetical protein